MAELRNIRRNPGISNFKPPTSSSGGSFLMLAEAMQQGYDMLAPVAAEKLKAEGDAAGRQLAKNQIGASSFGGGSDFRSALRQSESGGDYSVVNSEGYGGAYQWGKPRLADYNRATGQNITFEQFLQSPDIQEKAQDWHEADILKALGGYVGKTVNGITLDEGAIIGMAHLGGIGGARQFIESGGASDPADSNGTNLSDYARKFSGLSTKGVEPVTVRTAEGKIEPRLYSPASGPLLQVYNAAAQTAYTAEVMNKGAVDLLDMQNRFLLDPEGFKGAADAYISQIVEGSPAPFRGDIRSALEKEAYQSYLGVIDRQQSDIRQRAANSVGALVDRWSTRYAEELAAGNGRGAAAARAELDSALKAYETLPGVAWTPEQSTNAILDAEAQAERIRESARNDAKKEIDRQLDTAITAAKAGQSSAYDGIALDPSVIAISPDKAREAAAQIALRDGLPSFSASTPAERQAAINDLRSVPVTAGWQTDIVKAAEATNREINAAYEADPVNAARTYQPVKPPTIPDPQQDPQGFVDGIAARAAYMNDLVQKGHVRLPSYFDKTEAAQFSAYLGKGADPGIKLALSAAIVQGGGADAARMFKQLNASTPTTMAGMLMARGGDEDTAKEIILGEHMLDSRTAQPPTTDERKAAFAPEFRDALAGLPDPTKIEADVMAAATAIWAANGGSITMPDAVQKALGKATDAFGRETGGVAVVAGHNVLLPVGVNATDLDQSLMAAFQVPFSGMEDFGSIFGDVRIRPRPGIWEAAGVSPPMKGGVPAPYTVLTSDAVRIRPDSQDPSKYIMLFDNGETVQPFRDANGGLFRFDPFKLIEAAR